MKRIVHLLTSLALAAAVGREIGVGADAPATPNQPPPVQVGDYGRQSALVIEGNQTFTRERILSGMKLHLDYHLAAHPAAPLADYTAGLEHKITLGYQRAGFPAVTVKAAVHTNAHHLVVHVNEGPRYRCGDILLSGVPTMTNDMVRRKIAQVMAEFEDLSAFLTNVARGNLRGYVEAVAWRPGEPAPFDVVFSELLTNRVQEALSALGFCQPRFTARIVPDSARKLADLKIEFADEGFKGTIAEIEVNGLYTNTRPQLLAYLKLKPGMELNAQLVAAASNQLWLSARFFRHDVSLVPLPPPGQFKLRLDLDEVREAPPLDQEFSPKEKALLKFRDWLAGWERRPEDFVVSVSDTNGALSAHPELILSPSGTALAIWDVSSNGLAGLQYAFVASKELIGLYSGRRQSKFTMPRINDGGFVLLKVRPPSPKSYGQGAINFQIMMGLQQSQPFRLEMELQPAVFLSMAHGKDSSLKDGVLTLRQTADDAWGEIHIDVATGRLLRSANGSSESNAFVVRLQSEEGALARLNKEIAAATADYPNCYVTNRGFSSWASFMIAEVMKPPLLKYVLGWFDGDTTSKPPQPESHQDRTVLALTREILGQGNLDAVFEPLNQLFSSSSDNGDEKYFVVPVGAPPGSPSTGPLAMFCVMMLNASDGLVPGESWPGVLMRESFFTVAGQNPYTQAELDKLLKSDDMGPAGCLATAHLLRSINPKLARTFAERGLARLNLDEFRKDYRLLQWTNSIVGDLAGNVLGLLNGVDVAKLTPMLAELGPDEAAFLQQLFRLLADAKGKGQSPADSMWPALEQHWAKIPRRYLELGLSRFLPQVQFLTNSQALVDRGRLLLTPDSVRYDLEEAAQCYRKAADQGHGEAQVSYGHLCESGKGVPKDLTEAMRWYRKAAEQKATHAMCSIATLYFFGKGVPPDLDEAARWYRLELATVEDCAHSQSSLGQIYEAKNEMDEALKWYRGAAEGGWRPAQAKLGDLLSDGLSTTPDYVEACQWLTLAGAAGDKISEVRLRRVRAKLSGEQVAEVEKRVAAVAQHLEAKQKEPDKKATKPWRLN